MELGPTHPGAVKREVVRTAPSLWPHFQKPNVSGSARSLRPVRDRDGPSLALPVVLLAQSPSIPSAHEVAVQHTDCVAARFQLRLDVPRSCSRTITIAFPSKVVIEYKVFFLLGGFSPPLSPAMATQQQALLLDTIVALKKAVKRKAYGQSASIFRLTCA